MRTIKDFSKEVLAAYIEHQLFICNRFNSVVECLEAVERLLKIARLEQQVKELDGECTRLLELPNGQGVKQYLAVSQKGDRLDDQLNKLRSLPYFFELLPRYKDEIFKEIADVYVKG